MRIRCSERSIRLVLVFTISTWAVTILYLSRWQALRQLFSSNLVEYSEQQPNWANTSNILSTGLRLYAFGSNTFADF